MLTAINMSNVNINQKIEDYKIATMINSKLSVQTLFYGDCFDNYKTVPENELFMTFHSLSIPKPKR